MVQHLQKDGSGWQNFSYGKLGELAENIRTFALPFEEQPYTFKMQYTYDSYNRMQSMTYPDGEMVSYGYNRGGMLNSIAGVKNGMPYKYLDSIRYNRFEMRDTVFYGNGTWTEYAYDTLQRLKTLKSHTSSGAGTGELMQDIVYEYDHVGNITEISNTAGRLANGLGNRFYSHYTYDDLYRLTGSNGWWNGEDLAYQTQMSYLPNGRIERKYTDALVLTQTGTSNTLQAVHYDNRYHYNISQPNTLSHIDTGSDQEFQWDAKGNMTKQINYTGNRNRYLCWDEQNRLLGVADEKHLSYYQYDANGERTLKLTGSPVAQNVSGQRQYIYPLTHPTLYASPYIVCNDKGYTKHYYAESERIASRIGGGGLSMLDMAVETEWLSTQLDSSSRMCESVFECLDAAGVPKDSPMENLYDWRDSVQPEKDCYWYHPDHLGSSSWITCSNGTAVQHLHYLPWGEDFVDQRLTSWAALYTFSAKERDTETGLSYFGSRYYSSDLSIWLSVDPMSDKYPSFSPYVYCADNPVRLVDPNGEEISEHIDKYGNIIAHFNDGDNSVYLHKSGTTEADINTQRRVLNNTGGEGKKVGELGGNIDQSGFFDNKLQLSAQYARKISKMGIVNRYISFYEKVKTNGDWDLKNNNSNNHQSPMRTIWGIAWKYDQDNGTNTTFSCDHFSNASAADVGNFHAGYVGVISGFSDEMLFRGAGIAEVVKLGRRHDPTFKEHFVELIWGKSCKYGDQQQDYLYNALGMEYAKKNR